MDAKDPLDLFLPPVRRWFGETLGEPTPPQRMGWPAIAAGQHTLILAPTGSGKTLAAFLACLDGLWRTDPLPRGVRVLYVSPLKALNNDIHRNLQVPLEGVAETARRMGYPLPVIEAAVRTGDTSTAERQRLVRKPPHVLITTPESLHLLLTSRARETLRNVTHVIVDEIHALCPTKRGVFLSLLLERLEVLSPRFVRIGLSATQRPLEEVGRYLGGSEPVTLIDAGIRKDLDLQVVCPVEQFGPLPEKSVWPSIYRLLADEVRAHRSTIVFGNNRRAVERITACLNEEGEIARAHHGSVSLEARRETEQALKDGRLPAVVATASLELGIDMGAVDLVCQVESPGNVARALQRVGRAGHVVGQKSKGRLIPKTNGDLLEQGVLAREMAAGRVEEVRVPINCLDVLAQQLVAMTAMDPWNVPDLFALVRRAYPYRDLSPQAFEATLEMISGRFQFAGVRGQGSGVREEGLLSQPRAPASESNNPLAGARGWDEHGNDSSLTPGPRPLTPAFQPRVSWDRVHNRLLALPGTQQLALVNGGTIPDTGQYAAYTAGGVRVGELDEEFVYERRVGDAFLLGTNAWRLDRVEADRVFVSPAEGAPAIVPFWRGESTGRSHDLGVATGCFLRELQARLGDEDRLDWLCREFHLDMRGGRNLCYYVGRQVLAAGCVPTDRTILIEASRDQLGDWQVILLSPLGSRLHLGLRLALEGLLRQRLGYRPQSMHHDDGLVLRLTDSEEPITDLFTGLTPDTVERLILDELADSPLFALRFRQNAARALLMPRGKPGQRAPLWLQRLRGRDLLQVARQHPDFPVVVETFRECLHDHLDVPRLKELLADVRDGRVEVVTRRADVPCPFASNLLFRFTASAMYQYDEVETEGKTHALDEQLLGQLVAPQRQGHLLDPRAVHQVERRLRGMGQPPRTVTEMAEWLRRLGDLAPAELEGPMAGFLEELERDGRAARLELPRCAEASRWVSTEELSLYGLAFGMDEADPAAAMEAGAAILARFLDTHALVGLQDVLARYPFEADWARRQLEEWGRAGRVVPVQRGDGGPTLEWSAPANLEQIQRGSLAVLRREIITCSPPQFADFLLRWQGVHPSSRQGGAEGLEALLDRLEGLPLPADLCEKTVLPARLPGYQPRWLDDHVSAGSGVPVCAGSSANGISQVAFFHRETLRDLPAPPLPDDAPALDADAARVLDRLQSRGAAFVADLAADLELSPTATRAALWSLLRRGLVANDRFDVIRRGPPEPDRGAPGAALSRRPTLRIARSALHVKEGRWAALAWGRPEPEELAILRASLLLRRYGVVSRELAILDPWLGPWRVLYEVLSRMELAGEVRRGYFVEGLSGAQFALPEAAERLQDLHLPSTASAPAILLHSQDPANLYGAGAPFDVALLDGGTRPLSRRAGNWLVLRAGRPVLLVEQQGKKLTALPSASRDDVLAATACLPGIVDGESRSGRFKLTVEEWNGRPVTTSEGLALLEEAGFVRDYQGMTLYAAFRG